MRVAIVDDDASVCRSIMRLLRQVGMSPSAFESAERLLASRPYAFDCLLVDVQLGAGMSGLELHRRLLSLGNQTPVIYLTASDDPPTEAAARLLGCAGFIQKGAPPDLMLKALLRVQEELLLAATGKAGGAA
jgi:FixJ family two-component response regulator